MSNFARPENALKRAEGEGWQLQNDSLTTPLDDGDTVMGEPDNSGPITRARSRGVDEMLKNAPKYGDIFPPSYFINNNVNCTFGEQKIPPFLHDIVSSGDTYNGPTLGELAESGYKECSPFPDGFWDMQSQSSIPQQHTYCDKTELTPPCPRRSQRMSKYAGRYGSVVPTPLPPEYKYLLRRNAAKMSEETYEKEFAKLCEIHGTHHFFEETPVPSVPQGPTAEDILVNIYVGAGLSKEVVPFAVRQYGDNAAKVQEFAEKFTYLRELVPNPPRDIIEALLVHGMDMDKALAVLPLLLKYTRYDL